ncbi:hypothetical protein [Kineococcus rubinsiae]|uniref:hypothetical protein n=1 Tax=Kineococcus rubinsiae TaxID=2609562 RepID=UPI0014302FFB|nr:hypothetical protein [Kineococcus rubinsiae]NIZ93242.1 hypothetical protein [Kineococcus rubinsiae]
MTTRAHRPRGARASARLLAVTASLLAALTGLGACSDAASSVGPPSAPAGSAAPPTAPATAPGAAPASADTTAAPAPGTLAGDPAVVALDAYLREQALAINAQVADPAALPAFTATLTPAAQQWAVPLLAENLGDEMPGPYPVGVLGSDRPSPDRVELSLCLQDRGWQVDRRTGAAVNAPHFSTGSAVVLRVGDRWLVDDVVTADGTCAAGDVAPVRF